MEMIKPPETIETGRLLMRPPRFEDAEAIFADYAQDPDVTRYLIWAPHRNIDETRQFLERCRNCWSDGSAYPWAIIRKEDRRLLGMIEIRIEMHRVEIGYVLAKPHWGKGYMPEAARAVTEWALNQEGLYRVWAYCDIDNRPSARVLEKIGMVREGVLRRWMSHVNISDTPRDCFSYSIVK